MTTAKSAYSELSFIHESYFLLSLINDPFNYNHRSHINLEHSVWLFSWVTAFPWLGSLFPLCSLFMIFLFLSSFQPRFTNAHFFFVSILRTEPKHLCVCKARTLPLSYISRQACCVLLFVIFIPS